VRCCLGKRESAEDNRRQEVLTMSEPTDKPASANPAEDTPRTSVEEARRVGDAIGIDWSRFDIEQFRAGMDVEYEHGAHDPQTDVTGDDPIITGKIALAHMKEFPDYYDRLARMEREAEAEWAAKRG
jgi:Protein of unknown function (DUF5661)